ncbi:hypothetical protein B0H13DRAFT_2662732 [Mycena leptocephala]|nr:hypothetical protein B0H13DRAFT_2662732 [Mycena leptocephala]
MRFVLSFLALAPSAITLASAQSCTVGGKVGTCKFTNFCLSPEFEHIPGYCPGITNYQCCIPTGCVICSTIEERDLQERSPCC